MAESITSDGQARPVPSDFHDRGQPPTYTTPTLDSPLSPVSSEDLDISSPVSDGYKPSPYQNPSNPQAKNTMEKDRIAVNVGGDADRDRLSTGSNINTSMISTDSGGSPRRSKPTRHETDVMKLSAISGDGYTDSLSSSRPASAASSRSPYKEKEAERRQKEKEKEERVRLARQRMAEERQRKLIELKEQQRIAEENRERQLELRRKKIEELRKREEERRAAVEERRLKREATERSKREAILQRASERLTRYEAWKSGGRKGGSGGLQSGFGSRTPRDICKPSERPKRSSSHSALVRHSPNSSDYGYMSPQRRAISACSSVRRHCCVDINRTALNTIPESRRSFLAPTSSPPQRPKSTVNLNTTTPSVKLREKSARKPRPASVATSMPSFISSETPKSASQRSISTDRLSKDKKARKKDVIEEIGEKRPRKSSVKFSRHSVDRLSAPKQRDVMATSVELPKRDPIIKRSPKKAYSTTNLAMTRKSLPANVKLSKETPPRMQKNVEGDDKKVAVVKPSPSVKTTPSAVPPIKQPLTPKQQTPTPPKTHTTHTATVAAVSSITEDTPKDEKKDVEDYKARLAEARRLAREKAEKEAEEERRIQEIERLKEEERLRQEEEEQRRFEEEALRLAEEARKIEEERLQKAIEAETKRREEEAKKLEEEKKAKELADQKAQEEAEQLERERVERAKKEEEERIERKRRLEMIMKRVKTDGQSDSSRTESPNKSVTSSPSKTLITEEQDGGRMSNGTSEEDITKPSVDMPDSSQYQTPDKLSVGDSDKPRFRSPLLQQMAENKSDSPGGDRPKFKSPLLQNLLGKNKAVARVGGEKPSEETRAGEILNALKQKETLSFSSSQSLTNLSQTSDSLADKESLEKNLSKSVFNINMKDEDKDIDTTESDNSSDTKDAGDRIIDEEEGAVNETSPTSSQPQLENGHIESNNLDNSLLINQPTSDNGTTKENGVILKGGADSGVLMDLGESGTSLQSIPVNGVATYDLIDSSISMQSVDSNISSTGDIKEQVTTSTDFEELIDLSSIPNKNNVVDLKTESSHDLLNLNNIEDSEERENRSPFIAFEENSNLKQDVQDLLS